MKIFIPLIGFIFSKNFYAYNYLSNSSKVFPHGKSFNNILKKNGFIDVEDSPQTFGVASIYFAKKGENIIFLCINFLFTRTKNKCTISRCKGAYY